MICKRHYFKWNINELIALQREYELLELSVQEIANIHKRSIRSILCKLDQENFIRNWNEAKGFKDYLGSTPELEYIRDDEDDEDDDDDDEEKYYEDESLSEISIETEEESEINYTTQVNNIGFIMSVKKMFQDLSYVYNKFTNVTGSNNSSTSNLSEK
jgi:hypothetical protein